MLLHTVSMYNTILTLHLAVGQILPLNRFLLQHSMKTTCCLSFKDFRNIICSRSTPTMWKPAHEYRMQPTVNFFMQPFPFSSALPL